MSTYLSHFTGKKVLVTGHTGFKGSWLSLWLVTLGAEVVGISDKQLPGYSAFDLLKVKDHLTEDYRCDVRDLKEITKKISDTKPDIIFHLAAEALVGDAINNPSRAYSTNAIGTANILLGAGASDCFIDVICVTSDKVYENREWIWGYRETDLLGGKDPYSASKAMAELAIGSLHSTLLKDDQGIRVAVARAGNVIGGGDWAKNRIVPDAMRAWSDERPLEIRSPHATRPWQHVLEPLSGYLEVATWLSSQPVSGSLEAFNFGPDVSHEKTVIDLLTELQRVWSGSEINVVENHHLIGKEAGLLKLNCDKASSILNWKPRLTFEKSVEMTSLWYWNFYRLDADMVTFSLDQITEYQRKPLL